MATESEIPVRGSVSGQVQLTLLRSYLKDSDSTNYKYPDELLIQLLIVSDAVSVWQDISGAGKDSKPWTYNPFEMGLPLNRLRLMIGDTVEENLKYTDYELLKFLTVIPLRYIITMVKAKDAGGKSLPADLNDPIRIVREYLNDKDGEKYTDAEIVDQLFDSGLDPFSFVVQVMKTSSGSLAASSTTSGTGQLASIDGISFDTKSSTEELGESVDNQAIILNYGGSTIYGRGSEFYGFWMDGENISEVDWESEWYAL